MIDRRRSAAARLVPPQTPERPFELTQEHIRPLLAMIDRLNEAGAEDELRVMREDRIGQRPRTVYSFCTILMCCRRAAVAGSRNMSACSASSR